MFVSPGIAVMLSTPLFFFTKTADVKPRMYFLQRQKWKRSFSTQKKKVSDDSAANPAGSRPIPPYLALRGTGLQILFPSNSLRK